MTDRQRVHYLDIANPIPPERWGRDHQTTLLYAETRAVDHAGRLKDDDSRMRAIGREHPTMLIDVDVFGHDDYDCLRDAEAAGFIVYRDEIVRFTDAGWLYVHGLRRQRAERALREVEG